MMKLKRDEITYDRYDRKPRNNGIKTFLLITNPIVWPIGLGVLLAVITKNLFGGVAKDCVKIAKTL